MSRIHFPLFALIGGLAVLPVAAAPLSVATVGAPAINCVFNQPVNGHCTVTVTDSVGTIALPPGVSGVGRVQSRTFVGAAGTPGAGMTAYEYRVDLTGAVSGGEVPCVTDLMLDFGAIVKLPYKATPAKFDIFVITSGGIGSVGVFSAERTGNSVDIVFNQPVCAGPSPGTGLSSYFVGLASASAPQRVVAHVGWPGLNPISVEARGPVLPRGVPLKHVPLTPKPAPLLPKPH